MTVFERIRDLAKKRGKSVRDVALNIGLSENAIYGWKKTKPKAEDLALVADELFTTVDYLLGREELPKTNFSPELNEAIDNAEAFEGTPLTNEDKAILRGVIAAYLENRDKNKK